MEQNKLMTVVILAATVALGGCQASSGQGPEDYSDALIVVAGSRDVTFHRLRGTHRLTYLVETDYPATQTIQKISKQLQSTQDKRLGAKRNPVVRKPAQNLVA